MSYEDKSKVINQKISNKSPFLAFVVHAHFGPFICSVLHKLGIFLALLKGLLHCITGFVHCFEMFSTILTLQCKLDTFSTQRTKN